MNQKKRQKLRRVPAKVPQPNADYRRQLAAQDRQFEQAFTRLCTQIRTVLASVHPLDALTALNISDLWDPNRASQVKHQLAFCLLVSTPGERFAATRLMGYDEFSVFCHALRDAYPAFAMLEDYVPESDWGAIKVLLGREPVAILGGGPVQRISDFMAAFRINHGEGSQAVDELDRAIRLQAELLRRLPDNGAEDDRPHPGHLEIPPHAFWEAAVQALQTPFADHDIDERFGVGLGQQLSWKTEAGFTDAILCGTALPWQAVRIDGVLHPVSWRNTATVVLDAWSQVSPDASQHQAARLGAFLSARIKERTCLPGPLILRTGKEMAPAPIAAVLTESDHHFLIVPVPQKYWSQAGKVVAFMRRLMQDPRWSLQRLGTRDGFQLGDGPGAAYPPDAVTIILVSTRVSTALSSVQPPSAQARLMSLVDACTIFDAIDSVEEFARFWAYADGLGEIGANGENGENAESGNNGPIIGASLSDLVDLYGSFRDAHGQILEGAIEPDFLSLDPHWGASWRYNQLRTYWAQAPRIFPDEDSAWQTRPQESKSGLQRLTAKNAPRLAWCAAVGACTLHFILDVLAVELEPRDGRLLELFAHIAADSIVERSALIEPFLQLPFERIRVDCYSAPELLPTAAEDLVEQARAMPLITAWDANTQDDGCSLTVRVTVNLVRLSQGLEDNQDAGFEVECAMAVLERLCETQGQALPLPLRNGLAQTAGRRPRFTLTHARRTVDVPDFTQAQMPTEENYKVARRGLAFMVKDQAVVPGTYMLDEAKVVIDATRVALRDAVHQRIRPLDRDSVLRYCVEQYDAMIAGYDRDEWRIKLSLAHDVDFDREHDLAQAHETFMREGKNFRYMLECAVVLAEPQAVLAAPDEMLRIHAMVDWLYVLYGASDVLHNGIEVAGLEVDDQFIPEVFYSDTRDGQEEAFRLEQAGLRLGHDVIEDDQLGSALSPEAYREVLDTAFAQDLQFTYTQLLQVLSTLVLWVSAGGAEELACSYASDRDAIADLATTAHQEMSRDAALAAIDFLTLESAQVWRLLGKEEPTEDVPIWEHAKRGARHAIRPLIALSDGKLLWGAAAVARTRRIWVGSITAGYLPADYPWPAIRQAVSQLKKELENGLETRAFEICQRCLPFTIQGIDFRDRFPKQRFADVGDFDVLAYNPEENHWVTVECKYNQPAFSLKDTRRLRDRIFGRGNDRGQIRKIEGRRAFLTQNVQTLRTLLGWPEPAAKPFALTEIYVSKDLHFWLRFPPYELPTQFVQIDTLDAWLRKRPALWARGNREQEAEPVQHSIDQSSSPS